MFDLATAAVEGALAAGARYADARVMLVRYEAMSAKNRVVEGLDQTETAGVGVRALDRLVVGVPVDARRSPSRRPARRASGRPRWPGPARSSPARRVELAPTPVVEASWASTWVEHPLDDVAVGERADLLVERHRGHRRRRHPAGPGQPPDLGHAEVVRLERGQPDRPAPRRVRGRHRRHGASATARRSAAATRACAASTAPAAGSWCGSSTCSATPPRIAEEAQALLRRAAVPGDDHDADPRQRADGAPDPRVGRPRHRARPDPRVGGRVRRHVVARPRPARVAPLRLRPHEHHRRRHPARRARQLRLRRRGRPRAGGRHRQGRHLGRRALRARLGAARRRAVRAAWSAPTAPPGCRWCA